MTEYGLDVDAGQIVHWLKDDQATEGHSMIEVRATREYATEPVADRDEAGISEDTDVAMLTTTGTLELRPLGVGHVWVLRVRIDDVVGSHLPEDESVPEDAEEIDLDAFYEDFIVPDSGTTFVSVEAETEQAKHAFDHLFAEIITDWHDGYPGLFIRVSDLVCGHVPSC